MNKYDELLFRHIFETQIRKTFILALATNDFLQMLLKYRKELPTIKFLPEKQVSKSPSFCR